MVSSKISLSGGRLLTCDATLKSVLPACLCILVLVHFQDDRSLFGYWPLTLPGTLEDADDSVAQKGLGEYSPRGPVLRNLRNLSITTYKPPRQSHGLPLHLSFKAYMFL